MGYVPAENIADVMRVCAECGSRKDEWATLYASLSLTLLVSMQRRRHDYLSLRLTRDDNAQACSRATCIASSAVIETCQSLVARETLSRCKLTSSSCRLHLSASHSTQYMASTLNMYADIGPGPNSHTWGCALLSKFPILNSTHHLLPSPHGELAPAIRATLDVYGELVDVVVAHNGQEEDPLDRELQSQELGRLMREAYPRPVIFLGEPGRVTQDACLLALSRSTHGADHVFLLLLLLVKS